MIKQWLPLPDNDSIIFITADMIKQWLPLPDVYSFMKVIDKKITHLVIHQMSLLVLAGTGCLPA